MNGFIFKMVNYDKLQEPKLRYFLTNWNQQRLGIFYE